MKKDKGSFENMKRTMRRRAQKARERQETGARLLAQLMEKVVDASDNQSIIKRDPKKQQMYNDLNDTFKAFDRDNNAQLTWAEYREAWRFLSSIMGESAADYGYLADLENLESLLRTLVEGGGSKAVEALTQAQKSNEALQKQIKQLTAELERQRSNASGD